MISFILSEEAAKNSLVKVVFFLSQKTKKKKRQKKERNRTHRKRKRFRILSCEQKMLVSRVEWREICLQENLTIPVLLVTENKTICRTIISFSSEWSLVLWQRTCQTEAVCLQEAIRKNKLGECLVEEVGTYFSMPS